MKQIAMAAVFTAALAVGACENPTANRTLAGGAIGAGGGAVIGAIAGNAGMGAAIGGAAGLAGGFLSSRYQIVPRQ